MKEEDLNKLKSVLEEKSNSINIETQNFIDMEEQARQKFESAIKGYVPHKKYDNIKKYIQLITTPKTKINCLVLESEQGVGKTTVVKNILKNLKKEVLYINSYTTVLSFYKLAYENRFSHIVLDDVCGLFSEEKGISILRTLTNTEEVRYIKYHSTSEKLDVPSSFNFEGSVIILTNKITKSMDNSFMGRVIHRKIKFTLKEKLEMAKKIIKFQYDLTQEELKEVMDFVNENIDETVKNFSFRNVLKIVEFFINEKENWKELGLEELKKDKVLVFVKSIMNLSIDERNKKWKEYTENKSIRYLQKKIKHINEQTNKRTNHKNIVDLPVKTPKTNKRTNEQECPTHNESVTKEELK